MVLGPLAVVALGSPLCAQAADVRIVPMHAPLPSFAERFATASAAVADSAFSQQVVLSHRGPCPVASAPDWFARPANASLDTLAAQARRLERADVTGIVRRAAKKAQRALPAGDVIYCIALGQPYPPGTLLHGVAAMAFPARRAVMLWVRPVDEDWRARLRYVVIHEHHHLAAARLGQASGPGLDAIVFEGKADAFARALAPAGWAAGPTALTRRQAVQLWRDRGDELRRPASDFWQRVMFGQGPDLPTWAGYGIGFHMIQSYLERQPTTAAAEWTARSPEEILEGSEFGS